MDLNDKPHEVLVDQDNGTWVRSVSLSGRVIHEWNARGRWSVAIAEPLRRHANHGGDDVIVLGLTSGPLDPRFDGHLCLLDADDPAS